MIALVVLFILPFIAPASTRADPADQLSFGTEMAGRGLWSEALFRFRQAEENHPGDARILNNIAVSLEALGLYDEALETYKQAVEQAPSLETAKRNYARFVEFYQAYRGGEPDEGSDETEVADADSDGGDATDNAAEPADDSGDEVEIEKAADDDAEAESVSDGGEQA